MSKRRNYAKKNHQTNARNAVNDTFSNPIARTGLGQQDLMQATQYVRQNITAQHVMLDNLYRGHWLVQNIINTIPDDILRKWINIKTDNEETNVQIDGYIKKIKLIEAIRQGLYWGRLYGGAIGLIVIKGDDETSNPLNINNILPDDFTGLRIFDRWTNVTPSSEIEENLDDKEYGLPKYYTITDTNTHKYFKVHHSKVVRFIGRELPPLEQVSENYWGASEIEAVYNEVVRRDNVAANIAGLTFKANRDYQKTDNLDQMLALGNAEAQQRFWDTIQARTVIESNFGITLLNKDDDIQNQQYTFTGLPEVYDRIMMDVSGASKIPVTKLFGRSPAGMNATGESDSNNYYDYIDTLRDSKLRPIIEKLINIICKSAIGKLPDIIEFEFPSLKQQSEVEKIDVQQKKSATITQLYQAGLIDKAVALSELKEIGINGITPEMIESSKGVEFKQADPFGNVNEV